MGKTFNKPNKLISVQFNTILQPIHVVIIIIIIMSLYSAGSIKMLKGAVETASYESPVVL